MACLNNCTNVCTCVDACDSVVMQESSVKHVANLTELAKLLDCYKATVKRNASKIRDYKYSLRDGVLIYVDKEAKWMTFDTTDMKFYETNISKGSAVTLPTI